MRYFIHNVQTNMKNRTNICGWMLKAKAVKYCLLIVINIVTGCRFFQSADDFESVLSIDTYSSENEWNTVWKSEILLPGKYYEASIPYRIIEIGNENTGLYAVVVPDDNSSGSLASVQWRSNHLETQQFSFFIPEKSENIRVVLGMRSHGRAEIGEIKIRELLPIDFSAVEYTSVPDYEPYGMCTHFIRWDIWGPKQGFSDEQVKENIQLLADAGIQWIRLDAHWVFVEEKEGIYDEIFLTRVDNTIKWAEENGIKVYLQIGGQPQWASTHPEESDFWAYGTTRKAEFKKYVRYMTERYKGRIKYWEVGNEVDWVFWKDSLSDYADYLKTAAKIIRKTDSENRILIASFAFNGTHVWEPKNGAEENALRRLYQLGIRPYFDILGIHFYPLNTTNGLYEAVSAINQAVTVMREFSDGDKPVWMTETGYCSIRNLDNGLTEQAEYLTLLYSEIIAHPKLEKIFWYNFRCKYNEGDYENNFGLVNNDFSERPALQALRDVKKHAMKPENKTMMPENR